MTPMNAVYIAVFALGNSLILSTINLISNEFSRQSQPYSISYYLPTPPTGANQSNTCILVSKTLLANQARPDSFPAKPAQSSKGIQFHFQDLVDPNTVVQFRFQALEKQYCGAETGRPTPSKGTRRPFTTTNSPRLLFFSPPTPNPRHGPAQQSLRGPRSSGPGYSQQAPPRQAGRGPIRLRQCKIADKTQEIRYIFGSLCAVSPNDFPRNPDGSSDVYIRLVEIVEISGRPRKVDVVVTARPLPGFPDGHISLSEPQRTWLQVGQADEVFGEPYDPFSRDKKVCLGAMDVEVGFARPNKIVENPYDQDELADLMYNAFPNHIFQPGQRLLLDVRSIPLAIQVKTVTLMDLDSSQPGPGEAPTRSDPTARGLLTNMTSIGFFKTASSPLKLKGSSKRPAANAIIGPDFKFEDMGIGGLDAEFTTVFRRAFASRIFPPALIDKLGIIHVKGMLLYGPPGTGKTLIARQIGKMLNAREPKVINGPEVLNKYVGQSEENIRKLFADAEKEYKEKGDESGLHIIIFDELDAVCKQRGSGAGGGTGVGDSVVNQLLSKLDGVDQLNNILLIGMTNRRDMIDDALLRPGRLELQIEISLPDEPGRLQILNIHTAKMKKSNTLSDDVDLKGLAAQTKNFSGADISGLVRSATSFAFSHYIKPGTTASVSEDAINMKISMQDFLNAMSEVRPAFGSDDAELEDVLKFGIIHFSPYVERILGDGAQFVENVRSQKVIRLTSVLLHGPPGSGKSALAAHIAMKSEFPLIKLVTPASLVGFRDEVAKKDYLHKVFTDAYKSPLSLLILDNVDHMIEWNPIGPRFSMAILQTLVTLLTTEPPKGHQLLILATTSRRSILDQLDVMTVFEGGEIAVPSVQDTRELATVLAESGIFRSNADVTEAVNTVQSYTNSKTVGVGIKRILTAATAAVYNPNPGQWFGEKLATEIGRYNSL